MTRQETLSKIELMSDDEMALFYKLYLIFGRKDDELETPRTPGALEGRIHMSDNFDETPDCLSEYI